MARRHAVGFIAMSILTASVVLKAPLRSVFADAVDCWNNSSVSISVGGGTGCMPPCVSGKKCMTHTATAVISCNKAGGNQSCNFCVQSQYYYSDGAGGWTYDSIYNWTMATPPSPLPCDPQGGSTTVLNSAAVNWCETIGQSWKEVIAVYKVDCNSQGGNLPDKKAETYYTP